MLCKQQENLKSCPCTYTTCKRRGYCCDCVRHHRDKDELPGCFFSAEEEKTYNRSVEFFIKCRQK